MLDVDRGQDVDAGVKERVDVLPAFLVAAARDVGVGVFVHDRGPRGPGQDGVEVHFLELRAPVGQAPGRDDLESLQERPRLAASVVQGERDDDVLAAFAEPVGFFEHLVGLAHPRRGPQEDPQRSTCHADHPSLGLGCDLAGTAAARSTLRAVTLTDGWPRKATSPPAGVLVDQGHHGVGAQVAAPRPRGQPAAAHTPGRCPGPVRNRWPSRPRPAPVPR